MKLTRVSVNIILFLNYYMALFHLLIDIFCCGVIIIVFIKGVIYCR